MPIFRKIYIHIYYFISKNTIGLWHIEIQVTGHYGL